MSKKSGFRGGLQKQKKTDKLPSKSVFFKFFFVIV